MKNAHDVESFLEEVAEAISSPVSSESPAMIREKIIVLTGYLGTAARAAGIAKSYEAQKKYDAIPNIPDSIKHATIKNQYLDGVAYDYTGISHAADRMHRSLSDAISGLQSVLRDLRAEEGPMRQYQT